VVLLPLLLAVGLMLIDKPLYSLPSLILGFLILAECLIGRNLDNENAEWLQAWGNREWQRAYELMAAKRSVQPVESVSEMHSLYQRVWSEVWLQRVFSTLFWFGLFGVEGAILYRLTLAVAGRPNTETTPAAERELVAFARQFVTGLDWLPARLLASTFIITGNLSYAFSRVLDNWIDYHLPAAELIALTAQQATHAASLPEEYSESFISLGALQVETLNDLLRRSLLIWVVGFALCTLMGWIW